MEELNCFLVNAVWPPNRVATKSKGLTSCGLHRPAGSETLLAHIAPKKVVGAGKLTDMRTDVHSTNLHEASKEAGSALEQAGEVALKYLEQTGQATKNQSFMIFQHMAERAAKLGELHPHIEFEAAALKEIVAPDSSKDPSGWISQLWKDLEKRQERWAEGMNESARSLGLSFVPVLKKVPGSPAKYILQAESLSESDTAPETATMPKGGLRYTSAAVAAPGSFVRATLRGGIVAKVMPVTIFAVVILVILTWVLLLLGWWMFSLASQMNSPVTTAQLANIFLWLGVAVVVYRAFRFVGDLGDLGIVMAPEIMVPFKEDHVTLEVRRSPQDKEVNFAFVRYTGICPVCGGTVLLHDGQREFEGRIVGRCRISPREHVFAFDQRLHIGHPLRGAQWE